MARKSAMYKKIAAELDEALDQELIQALKNEGFDFRGNHGFWEGRSYRISLSVNHRGGTFVGFVAVGPSTDVNISIGLNPSLQKQIKVPNATLQSTCAALAAYFNKTVGQDLEPHKQKIDAQINELQEAKLVADRMWRGARQVGDICYLISKQ
jgi:hypothetical protein